MTKQTSPQLHFTNALVALGAAAMTAESQLFFHSFPKWEEIIFAFASTFLFYSWLRGWRFLNFIYTYLFPIRFILILLLLSGSIDLFFFTETPGNSWLKTKGLLFVLTAFFTTFYPTRKKVKQRFELPFALRSLPYFKAAFISLCWVLITTIIPFHFENLDTLNSLVFWNMTVSRFLFVFALATLSDVADMHYDEHKLKTLPLLIGKPYTLLVCFFLGISADLLTGTVLIATVAMAPAIIALQRHIKGTHLFIELSFILHALFFALIQH